MTYDRNKSITAIKMLGIEAINAANSGHPGIVLGAAPMSYALYTDHLNINPQDDQWINRDRFILSAGHGSALLYALLHLSGFNITINDLKNFRKLNSITPGHPEKNLTPGVDVTTGPLGQGLAMAVGAAVAETFLAAKYNKPNLPIIDHYTYAICSDGDLQEGISQEAISLAGHWKLNKLIVLYDSNDIQLDGPLNEVQSEQTQLRMQSVHWNYILVKDGSDFTSISKAIAEAKKSNKPTLIEIKTIIGAGASKENTSAVHGAPLGKDIDIVKSKLSWQYKPFEIPDDVKNDFNERTNNRGQKQYQKWQQLLKQYQNQFPQLATELEKSLNNEFQISEKDFQDLIENNKTNQAEATRVSSGKVLQLIGKKIPNIIGGNADLSGSTRALLPGGKYGIDSYQDPNIMFGVREFAMGAITNGIISHGGLRTFSGTFFSFADYMKPAIRLAAIMELNNIFIFTHDSIAVGEDGPTHQPVEQLTMLRSVPNLSVIRPCDMNETIGAYLVAWNQIKKPTAIILSRQNLTQLPTTSSNNVSLGAYIVCKETKPLKLIIIATGSEVGLAVEVKTKLENQLNIGIRVVSMPSCDLFDQQSLQYKSNILPSNIPRVIIEMASAYGWYKYLENNGIIIGVDQFGASANGEDILKQYGFSVDQIIEKINNFFNK